MDREFDDYYYIHIRQKANQHHPFEAVVPRYLVHDNWISLEHIIEIVQENMFLVDSRKTKIRYLSERGLYILCKENGAPFGPKKILEIVVFGPSDSRSSSPNFKMSRTEKEMMVRIDCLEKTLINMESSIEIIANKLSLPSETPESLMELPGADEEMRSLGTPDKVSNGSPNFPKLPLVRTQSLATGAPLAPVSVRSQSYLPNDQSLMKKTGAFTFVKEQKDVLHFAILYSNPLVDIVEKKSRVQTALLINDPVDFSNECASILQCLESHKKLLNVHIECASSDKFISIVKEKPLIMHIMCHGDFDTEKQEYFLEFENSKAELLRMYPSKLKELLAGTNLSDIKLVFINACHSEAIGRAFLDLGVGCVIVSQSEHKLNDEFAKVYAKLFYDELIEGKSVSLAFENAKAQLKAVNINGSDSCCCGHSHKPDCSWYQYYKQNGKFLVNLSN